MIQVLEKLLDGEVKEDNPILGKTRYDLFQPVRFIIETEDITEEYIGIIVVRDSYGTLGQKNEPSYDIFYKLPDALKDKYSTSTCLMKHNPESKITALTEEEIKNNEELILYLEKMWK